MLLSVRYLHRITIFENADRYSHGWCGASPAHCGEGCTSGPCTGTTTTAEPVITVSTSAPTATGVATSNGQCGSQNGGATCAGWAPGECCSMYGWCGDSCEFISGFSDVSVLIGLLQRRIVVMDARVGHVREVPQHPGPRLLPSATAVALRL